MERARAKADNEFDIDRDNEGIGIKIENISSPKLQTRSDVQDQRTRVTEGLPNCNLLAQRKKRPYSSR